MKELRVTFAWYCNVTLLGCPGAPGRKNQNPERKIVSLKITEKYKVSHQKYCWKLQHCYNMLLNQDTLVEKLCLLDGARGVFFFLASFLFVYEENLYPYKPSWSQQSYPPTPKKSVCYPYFSGWYGIPSWDIPDPPNRIACSWPWQNRRGNYGVISGVWWKVGRVGSEHGTVHKGD